MQITSVRPILKGIMVASVDIIIPKWSNFFIRQIIVFDKNGTRWISFPSEAYEKDGVKKFARRCGFEDKEVDKKFQTEFFRIYDEYIKINPLKAPEPQEPKQAYSFKPSYEPKQYDNDPWY